MYKLKVIRRADLSHDQIYCASFLNVLQRATFYFVKMKSIIFLMKHKENKCFIRLEYV